MTNQPYFGLGASSALEDVAIFSDCIDKANNNMAKAVHEFSRRRAKDSETLVRISRDLDRPGFVGVVTFIIPIILDSIFNKINPKLFAPNMISMLQRDDMTFQQVAVRKRIDRIVQLTIIGSLLTGIVWTTKRIVVVVAKALGKRPSTVIGAMVAFMAGTILSRKAASQVLTTEMAPADVLTKMKTPIGKNNNNNNKDSTTVDGRSPVV